MSEQEKRKRIYEINAMTISQSEKAKLISEIMNPNLSKFKEPIREILFCQHYKKYTYPVLKCCNKVYPCRLCHDDSENHKTNRHDIDYMKCDFCKSFQKVNSSCQNPECFKFDVNHKYFCKKCNLWSDNECNIKKLVNTLIINFVDTVADVHHCDDCGICRMGKKEDFKHCKKCNLCLKKNIYDEHPCLINIKEQNCPICLKDIWGAFNDPPQILNCGHSVHTSCFLKSLESQNYFCSLCKKSMIDLTNYWSLIDNALSTQEMPEEFQNWTSDIYCNDCEKKSNAKYHFSYHKCQHCGGYNTVIDKVNKS